MSVVPFLGLSLPATSVVANLTYSLYLQGDTVMTDELRGSLLGPALQGTQVGLRPVDVPLLKNYTDVARNAAIRREEIRVKSRKR